MTRAETIALLGRMAEALGVALLIPLAVALALGEPAWLAFAAPAALGLAIGLLSRRYVPLIGGTGPSTGGGRAYRFVVLAWCLATVFGALPYIAEFGPGFAVNGLFESASGFSTTGATIFPEVESLPRSLLLWRALTQWLGGLGIIIIFVWLLGRRQWGVDVLTAEAPGPTPEKTEPKITETARDTVIVGTVLTAILVGLLLLLDVPAFDAVCHAFTTLATGGFSPRNESVGAFAPIVQWVIIAFMVIGGMRFAIHIYEVKRVVAGLTRLWRRVRGRRGRQATAAPAASYFSDPELRLYIGVVAVSTGLLFLSLYLIGQGSTDGLRQAAFTAVAIITTTGYSVVDYNQWPDFSRMLVLVLMFAGGCAGSTAGSIKILRWVILFRKVPLALRVATQPHTELRVHIGRRPIAASLSATIGEVVLLFVGLAVAGALAISAMGVDLLTAFSAAAAAVTNVGPGLGAVGPAASYAHLPDPAKILLAALMIAGRLEIVTVAVLLLGPIRSARRRVRRALF